MYECMWIVSIWSWNWMDARDQLHHSTIVNQGQTIAVHRGLFLLLGSFHIETTPLIGYSYRWTFSMPGHAGMSLQVWIMTEKSLAAQTLFLFLASTRLSREESLASPWALDRLRQWMIMDGQFNCKIIWEGHSQLALFPGSCAGED